MNKALFDSFRTGRVITLDTNKLDNLYTILEQQGSIFFHFNYSLKEMSLNENMIKEFDVNIEEDTTIGKHISKLVNERNELQVYQSLLEVKKTRESIHLDFSVKPSIVNSWYSLTLHYDPKNDICIGFIQKINKLKNKEKITIPDIDIMNVLCQNLPVSVYCHNENGDVLFSNNKENRHHIRINNDIKRYLDKTSLKYVDSINEIDKTGKGVIYRVSHLKDNEIENDVISLSIVEMKDTKYYLYVYNKSYNDFSEENKLLKILKANELIMELRDIVDNITDLNEMFTYLLARINTVIPDANRSCLLRIDDKGNLYLESSFGFEEEYVSAFSIPFTESYAYLHMQNDYSKPVIINDIQTKYAYLFPDLKDDQQEFLIKSNVTTPITVDGRFYGIVSVDSGENNVFDDVDLYLLDFMKIQIERAIKKYRKFRNMKQDSRIDPLTGIANRRHLGEIFIEMKEKSQSENKDFLFVIFDLDKLKKTNDNFGHICGDKIIQQFAFIVQKQIRSTDFLARIGGDEFVGLFYDVDEKILESRIAEWQNYFDKNPVDCKGQPIFTQFSYGISVYPNENVNLNDLLAIADKRMYKLKDTKSAKKQ